MDFSANASSQPTKMHANNRGNRKNDERIRKWLGGRDSNPDTVVQSHYPSETTCNR